MPKISELNAASNVATSDLLLVVKDPSGAPSTNKITTSNFMTYATRMMAYANTTATGGIKVGDNLTINSTGYLSTSASGAGLPTSGQDNGYVLQWSSADNSAVWSTLSAPLNFSLIYESNTYTATSEDYILFVDPNTFSNNIYVKLPASPLIGKVYQVKNIDPGDGYKVVVCISNNSSSLENPSTGEIVSSFDITAKGDSQEWVYDGTYYRHIGSQTALPFFSSEANTFTEIALQNRSSGNNASGDIVVYSDAGDPVTGDGPYVDIGINSSQYSNSQYSVNGPNDSYVYSVGGDLTFGTANTGTRIAFHTGGTTEQDVKLIVNAAGFFVNTAAVTFKKFDGATPTVWFRDDNTVGKYSGSGNSTIYLDLAKFENQNGDFVIRGDGRFKYLNNNEVAIQNTTFGHIILKTENNDKYIKVHNVTDNVGIEFVTDDSSIRLAPNNYVWNFTPQGHLEVPSGASIKFSDGTTQTTASYPSIPTRSIQTVSVVGPTTISSSVVFGDPNAAGANVNLLLPSNPSNGAIYTVKNINSGGRVVYVQTNGVLNIENESGSIGSGVYATISASGDFITWIYDNSSTTYRIIG
jgi:hypothetical protein